jgi:hypothetical protein
VVRRKGFVGLISLSHQCCDWLADMVEEALKSQGTEVFTKSFREDVKVLKVHKGCNKAGCFLAAVVFAEGNLKGIIWLLEGREGWGWRRFVDELRKLLVFLVAKEKPLVLGVNSSGGVVSSKCSYAVVVSSTARLLLVLMFEYQLDLFHVVSWPESDGGEVIEIASELFRV